MNQSQTCTCQDPLDYKKARVFVKLPKGGGRIGAGSPARLVAMGL